MTRKLLALLLVAPIAVVAFLASPALGKTTRPLVSHYSDKCVAIDGDTLVCLFNGSRVHLRLNGVDSPELAGHCRATRVCAPGDPIAAKEFSSAFVVGKRVRWLDLGRDKYGRTIAEVRVGRVDLSCELLRTSNAIYKPDWDNFKTLASRCPNYAH